MRENKVFCPRGNTDLADNEDSCFSWTEIVRKNIILDYILGEGEFGRVFRASLKDEKRENVTGVAVKTLKGI